MALQMQELVLRKHSTCLEAAALLRDFRLFLDQGFIGSLKPESHETYMNRLNAILEQIG